MPDCTRRRPFDVSTVAPVPDVTAVAQSCEFIPYSKSDWKTGVSSAVSSVKNYFSGSDNKQAETPKPAQSTSGTGGSNVPSTAGGSNIPSTAGGQTGIPSDSSKEEKESGPKKKKVSESTLVEAYLQRFVKNK
mgnify:CR=1 FL=1